MNALKYQKMSDGKQILIMRGSMGIGGTYGPPSFGDIPNFPNLENPTCREIVFTGDGSKMAWCSNKGSTIVDGDSYNQVLKIEDPKISNLLLSPKGTYISTWTPYSVKDTVQESTNLHIWDIQSGDCKKSFIQKKQRGWNPQWSDDEFLCARNVSNEVHFYEDAKFDAIAKKIHMQKIANFCLSPGEAPYHIVCFVPGMKGQPSFVRLFKYPVFEGSNSVIAQKSFYKAERVDFYWNKTGKDCMVLTSVDVDKSGASYYGELNLYYISVKGDTAKVKLSKDGPAYSVQWSPHSTEFCVVYGSMPAKATIYNLKCEPILDFDPAPRNEVQFSPIGERLSLSGFGNLQGLIEVWDLKAKKQISNFKAQDSTCIRWSPNGENILTATTSPRLRIGNGYRVWHYTGSLLVEIFLDSKAELFDILWKPVPDGEFTAQPTFYKPVPGIQSIVPQSSKEVYRPPAAQGKQSAFKLHDEESKPTESAALTKNQKKNLARKAKKETDKQENIFEVQKSNFNATESTGDAEKDKKIRTLMKKIDQIEKLKQDQVSGKKLEINQLEKIKKLGELEAELEKLQIS